MNKVEFAEIDPNVWDDFVQGNESGWFYHTTSFLKAWSFVGENVSFAIEHNSRIVALFVCHRYTLASRRPKDLVARVRKHMRLPYAREMRSYLHSDGGLVIDQKLTGRQLRRTQDFFREIIETMMIEYGDLECSISMAPLTPSCAPGNRRMYWTNPLTHWGFENKDIQSVIIDLQHCSEGELLAECSETTRQEIRKLQSNPNFSIRAVIDNSRDLETYYAMHVDTYTRTGARPFPKSCFSEFFGPILSSGNCTILLAEKNGEVIAGNITICYKGMYYYWANASKTIDDMKISGVNKALCYEQIRRAKVSGGGVF